jgi:DNA-binding XRE family transcriptional regulator
MENIIYCLKCPVTKRVHYIGKSTRGMIRPMVHLSNSHSNKIREWVNDLNILNHKPIIEILEVVQDYLNIDNREKFWISKCIDEGCILLNENLILPATIRPDLDDLIKVDNSNGYLEIGRFISERRKKVGLNQDVFANKTGVALTVLRKIEQGKSNINLNNLLEILRMFGYTITIRKVINNNEHKNA